VKRGEGGGGGGGAAPGTGGGDAAPAGHQFICPNDLLTGDCGATGRCEWRREQAADLKARTNALSNI